MALQDDLTAIQRCVDDLVRTVDRVEQRAGAELAGVDFRRVRMDTDHLRESVALLRATAASAAPQDPPAPPKPRPELVTIPDTPYDASLWTDSDDEGLGARDRRAP
ncbi:MULTISPECIES: hypothetical protein [Streptomyces]|uniref:Uncharacterized protein n=1 Tax=Streptomyces lasiicapitis TaxID=1923961 RepID=A0ABQ2LHU6_9ACTN|nr:MULTISPECIES: hypothetical protein [Streptomyces]QIB43767.1 hypothetical protein G3H79_12355 [Streptomyces aureoverticillatus]GGO34462.1 hypothetical protein GCM10012286_03530 [Streptomyces lasiicapitis]